MRKILFMCFLFAGITSAGNSHTRNTQESRPKATSVSGRWIVETDYFGTTIYYRMELKQDGERLTGDFDGDKLEGTLKGNAISFLAKDEEGGTDEGKATVEGGTITGTVVFTHPGDTGPAAVHKFTARLVP